MNLRLLLIINAAAMFAAGAVLFLWPGLIPSVVDIHLPESAYFLCYLLGASEFALAVLCCFGLTIRDDAALKAVVVTCIVFHAASAAAGAIAAMQGAAANVWWNVALRVVMVGLFCRYGLSGNAKSIVRERLSAPSRPNSQTGP